MLVYAVVFIFIKMLITAESTCIFCICYGGEQVIRVSELKVPKREIFDRSDFPDFYIIKSLCGGDFGVKKENLFKNN
jgi:hypothetical protein